MRKWVMFHKFHIQSATGPYGIDSYVIDSKSIFPATIQLDPISSATPNATQVYSFGNI